MYKDPLRFGCRKVETMPSVSGSPGSKSSRVTEFPPTKKLIRFLYHRQRDTNVVKLVTNKFLREAGTQT